MKKSLCIWLACSVSFIVVTLPVMFWQTGECYIGICHEWFEISQLAFFGLPAHLIFSLISYTTTLNIIYKYKLFAMKYFVLAGFITSIVAFIVADFIYISSSRSYLLHTALDYSYLVQRAWRVYYYIGIPFNLLGALGGIICWAILRLTKALPENTPAKINA